MEKPVDYLTMIGNQSNPAAIKSTRNKL